MLRIAHEMVEAMVAHARADHPEEACGLLVGPEGSGEALRHVPMTNAARSTTFYEFDAQEWKQVYDQMWANDEEVVVAYHSHTATEAYPSRSDAGIAAQMGLPGAHYVLVTTRDPEIAEVRSFTISANADVSEEPIEVVGAPDAVQTYKFAHTPERTVYDCR
ncbi:Mov34/MPN/PAD-1 family protein [Haloglycomyces albus]|uniref:Mov34/MPN/PAD-1 family protein n=1 Tax=Haloglycomyces albus TaxID=526067 RepID=UPI00046D31AC|nr:M67 family metallopeptidase [Haloglycomyces albus]